MSRPQVWLVSGPSSVGKSTFLAAGHLGEIPTLFPRHVTTNVADLPERCAVHYNILRLMDRPHFGSTLDRATFGCLDRITFARARRRGFDDDPPLRRLLDLPVDLHAIVLFATPRDLVARAEQREREEPEVRGLPDYAREKWVRVLRKCDLPTVYRDWVAFLDARGIAPSCFLSVDGEFRPAEKSDALEAVGSARSQSTRKATNGLRQPR